jgi:drug/metabolite transporter (DMT)-like permease
MVEVNSLTSDSSTRRRGLDPAILGTACCISSALCYTAANICMRQLTLIEADKTWAITVREMVSVAAVGPWLLVNMARGRSVLPSPRMLAALAAAGLAVQVAGNLPVLWAFDTVGLAVSMPPVFGVMLTGSALLGFVFLGERVSGRTAAAIALVIASIVLLNLGANGAGDLAGRIWIVLGIAAACLGGAVFAALGTVIRFAARERVPVGTIVFVTTSMGVLSLGALSVVRVPTETLLATPPGQLGWMLAAGLSNFLGFLSITRGLQLTTVVRANLLNASQVALLAVAGVMFFGEACNAWLVLGIVMTIVGIMLIGRPSDQGAS